MPSSFLAAEATSPCYADPWRALLGGEAADLGDSSGRYLCCVLLAASLGLGVLWSLYLVLLEECPASFSVALRFVFICCMLLFFLVEMRLGIGWGSVRLHQVSS